MIWIAIKIRTGDLYLVWVGLDKNQGRWLWNSTGEEATNVRWGIDQPSNTADEIYGCYHMRWQKIHDCKSHDIKAFVCEI